MLGDRPGVRGNPGVGVPDDISMKVHEKRGKNRAWIRARPTEAEVLYQNPSQY